jgi:flagellar hook-associated protein 2
MAVSSTSSSSSGSIIDVQTLVSQLMTVEQQPLTKLQASEAKVQSRVSALGNIQSRLAALRSSVASLASFTSYTATKASTTGTSASGAITGSPQTGTYTVAVSALAKGQSSASTPMDPAAALGVGNLKITLGTTSFDIATGGDGQPATLADLRDAINAQDAVGVSASLISSGGTSRLVLNSKDTGAANAFTLAPTGTLAGFGFTTPQAAADSSYSINGLQLTSASNTIVDAVDGVTVVLNAGPPAGSAPGTTVDSQITIAQDSSATKSKVNDFINAYNSANSLIRSQTSYDATTKTAGQLNGEFVLRQAQSSISAVLRGSMTAAKTGDYTRLSDLGVQVQKDGSLTLDSTKFDAAMAADPTKVQRLFAGTAGATGSAMGLAAQLRDQLDGISGSTGTLQARTDGLRSQIKTMDAKQTSMQARLVLVQKRLTDQYSKLDALLSSRQTDMNSLANSLARM